MSFAPPTVAFLGAIIDSLAHPIFVKDRQFRFVLLNRALCEMVGHSREEMLGKDDYAFFPKAEADFFRKTDERLFCSGATQAVDEEFITDAGGSKHLLATTKVPLIGPTGEVTYLVGIIHDITRLKTAEDGLRQANEELERRVGERTAALAAAQAELVRKERLAVLGQLAGGLAHQIRNPLGTITNAAYLLKRAVGEHPAAEVVQPLEIILEEAWKANRTISGLLDYARARPAVRRPVPIQPIVELALAAVQIPAAIAVHRDLPALPEIVVDPDQIREALANLVQNAVESMAQGGALTIGARVEGDEVVVSVSDTGEGISADVQRLLFQPLVTTKPLGLGLGLTTARMLIDNQRGSIAYRSLPGRGACFEVRLPSTAGEKGP